MLDLLFAQSANKSSNQFPGASMNDAMRHDPGSPTACPRMEGLPPEALDQVAAYFQALSEPTRLQILNLLRSGERNVGELAQLCGFTAANVSRHLAHADAARAGRARKPRHGGVLPDRGRRGLRALRSRLRQHRATPRAHRAGPTGIRASRGRRSSTQAPLSARGTGCASLPRDRMRARDAYRRAAWDPRAPWDIAAVSSLCSWHAMQRAASGSARRRSTAISSPQLSQTP